MSGLYFDILNIIQNLSPREITIIIGVTAFLLLYLVYRQLGLGPAVALIVIYLIAYVIYSNKLVNYYESQDIEKANRMKELEEELQK